MKNSIFFYSNHRGSSQFWQGLHKVMNGRNCSFWHDCWLQSVLLQVAYDNLYNMARDPEITTAACRDPEITTAECWDGDFRRTLSQSEFDS